MSEPNNKPDLIICVVLMPDMNGYIALAELRNKGKTSVIPVFFYGYGKLGEYAQRYEIRR